MVPPAAHDDVGLATAITPGADIEASDPENYNRRAIHWSARNGHVNVVARLLKKSDKRPKEILKLFKDKYDTTWDLTCGTTWDLTIGANSTWPRAP